MERLGFSLMSIHCHIFGSFELTLVTLIHHSILQLQFFLLCVIALQSDWVETLFGKIPVEVFCVEGSQWHPKLNVVFRKWKSPVSLQKLL